MGADQLFILDVSRESAAGLLCTAGARAMVPTASSYSELEPGSDIFAASERVISSCDAEGCRCRLTLPASSFYVKQFTLPFTDRRKIDQVAYYELQDLISFGDEPFVYDIVLIESQPNHSRWLATIIKESELHPWLELLNRHAMQVEVVTISSLARVKQLMIGSGGSRGSFIYLDIGTQESSLFHLINGGIDTIRVLPGGDSDSGERLKQEVLRTYRAQRARTSGSSSAAIKIGGAGGDRIGVDWLAGCIEFSEAEVVDSAGLGLSDNQAMQMLPLYLRTRLLGLAGSLNELAELPNIVRKKTEPSAGYAVLKKFAPALLALLAAIGLTVGYQMFDYRKMAAERDRLAAEARQIYAQAMDGRNPVADPVAELRARINEIDQSVVAALVEHPEISAVTLLSDISRRMPNSVQVSFERFSFDRREVRLDGFTESYNDVDTIKKNLERSTLYKAVAIESAGSGGENSGVRFSIALLL